MRPSTPFDHFVPVPELRDVEIPLDQAPGLTEVAVRADRHEVLYLVRAGDAPALLVMTEDAFEQAVQDARCPGRGSYGAGADERRPAAGAGQRHPEYEAFVKKFTR